MDTTEELKQLIRWGTIVSVNKNNTARVQFSDIDNIVSYDLHILVSNANKNRYQAPPDVGCNALCIMMPTGHSDGFIIGTFYNEKNEAPINSLDQLVHWEFEDGTILDYDKSTSTLTADVKGPVNVIADSENRRINNTRTTEIGSSSMLTCPTVSIVSAETVTVKSPDINLAGNVTISGDLTVISTSGAIVAQISHQDMSINGKIKTKDDIILERGNLSLNAGDIKVKGKISATDDISTDKIVKGLNI